MKRGQTETVSLLIGIFVMAMILIPIGVGVYGYWTKKTGEEKTLDDILKAIKDLKDGENTSVVGNLADTRILIGFEKGDSTFGRMLPWYCGVKGMIFEVFKKPEGCDKEKPCLCICDFDLVEFIEEGVQCSRSNRICKPVEVDFDVSFKGAKDCKFGPFFPGRGLTDIAAWGESGTFQFQIERQGSKIGICRELPCFPKDMQQARAVFDNLTKSYTECKKSSKSDCLCDPVDLSKLPYSYDIVIGPGSDVTNISIAYDQTKFDKFEVKNDLFCSYPYNEKGGILRLSKETMISRFLFNSVEYIADEKFLLYKFDKKNTCLVKHKDKSFDYVTSKLKKCSEKKTAPTSGGTTPFAAPQ
jgi:hypothetical protein